MFDRDQPFNDLPAMPRTAEVETAAVLKKAIAKSHAPAELTGMGTRQTCSKYLRELERLGVPHGQKIGREVYFINQAQFELLTR